MVLPVVNVKQGWLRGSEAKSITGLAYISFKAIPYAEPPVGKLRFRDPEPALPWTGIRDATTDAPVCGQFNIFTAQIEGEDDCLYLNISTKNLKDSRPVMVWIHPGGFAIGDGGSRIYGPDYLMEADIVYVSINYRLGVFGFLNLDHETAPGNMGLKDQVAALRWVKENISQFGGDPNNVTIFGISAGAASAHYLLLSRLAKGLFHKAIMQSGCALNAWQSSSDAVNIAHRLVSALSKDTKDPEEIVAYLRTIPPKDLVNAVESLRGSNKTDKWRSLFLPGVDDKSPNPLFSRSIWEQIARGFDVPVIIGHTSHEGLLFTSAFSEEIYSQVDANFALILPGNLKDISATKIAEIRNLYFHGKQSNAESIDDLIQCYGDLYFVLLMHRVIDAQATKRTPTYVYKFCHDNPNSFGKIGMDIKFKGAAHGDEVKYLFHSPQFGSMLSIEPGTSEQTISDRFIKMWTDFATTGNPTPRLDDLVSVKWEPMTPTAKKYLAIDAGLRIESIHDDDLVQRLKRVLDTTTAIN